MLLDLNKEIMNELGITIVGDIIAILKHAKVVYRQVRASLTSLGLGRTGFGLGRVGWGGFRGADGACTPQEMCKAATEALSPPSAPAELRRNASSGECGLSNSSNPRFLRKKSFGGALIHGGPPGSASSRLPHDRQQLEPGFAARHPHPPA